MAIASQHLGIGIRRHFTTEGVDPYDEVVWERRDARLVDARDGSVAFEQLGVEVPSFWSVNATNILAQKYFRGIPGTPEREWSLRQVVDRVVNTITRWGAKDGYFGDDAEARAFCSELKHLIIHQQAAFNSPVWFNIGVKGVPQQASACFILSVDDSMDSILNWYAEEGIIFKGGSGSGVNLSRLRSSKEPLSGGGTASGPVSFMRGADASAGTIKSGGRTRRSAKMVILNVDHPDIEEFIWCKAIEERKARALRDAGFDMDLDGRDSYSLQYQNANNSVRVPDEFMQAVLDDRDWQLRKVTTGEVVQTIKARELFRQIAKAAWECADPGVQFDTTINRWHTAPNTGRINGSNPCSEYHHLDNSACNLASINLLKFLGDDGAFDVEGFKAAVEVVFTAQEILVGNADYPTEKIADTARRFRELGLGYANLGALLMALGVPYDSDEGRAWAGAVTALMTGRAYATSARTAARMGPFAGFHENREAMLQVLRMHREEVAKIDEELAPTEVLSAAQEAWDEAVELAEQHGVRNSQASVLAPTGCLVGGTLVATERGLLRLRSLGEPFGEQWQDLAIDVQTDRGCRRATRFFRNGLEPVVRATTQHGYAVVGTPQHRVKVVERRSGQWSWKRLSDLAGGDLVPLALDQLIGGPQAVPLPPSPGDATIAEDCFLAPATMTEALAELVGYFMGQGFVDSRGLRLRVDGGDLDVVGHLERAAKQCFGLPACVMAGESDAWVRLESACLARWWESCGFARRTPEAGRTEDRQTAHVPDAVLHTNDRRVYAAFLRGLFEAAGDLSAGSPVLTSESADLIADVQSILLALGLPTAREVLSGRNERRGVSALRLVNSCDHRRFLEEIGFIGERKSSRAGKGEGGQTGGGDRIPLARGLVERLCPASDPLLGSLVVGSEGVTVSRRIATELYERTGDPELGRLLSFFYDSVVSSELGDEELTYDLSVPENVTYLANGFVSHNTIGLLMDCDTTGVEPDLSLVKTKKLVGGGTMSIVNQTVPRALARLGYDQGQIDDIVTYVDRHKSIVSAPHLQPEHLPVFACSMGDNVIDYKGHLRILGAVQPFISGAVSKTINTPEDITVEEVEQLYLDAWRLGIKAVAIYRDNCKVGQPLSTTKAGAAPEAAAEDTPVSEAEAHDRELAEKVAELEHALQHQTTVVVKQPIRERLPRTRRSKTFKFRVADCEGYVTVGEYDDGRPGEVFMKVSKQGSTLSGIMDAFAISVSIGLQHGVPLATLVSKYTNMRFEPAGMTDDPELRIASSLVDYIFRRLAVEYLPYDERAALGILTTEERLQPTLPGVEEAATSTVGVVESPAERPSAIPQAGGRGEVRDAPYCYECGNVMMRSGTCFVCPSCGTTSGCS